MSNTKVVVQQSGGPQALEVQTGPVPVPGEGELLVKSQAAGVSFADVMWVSGTVPGGPSLPFTPGYDVVGEVQAIGAAVSGFEIGDRVAALIQYGGYAEHVLVPHKWAVKLSANLNPVISVCLVLNYLTAYQIYHRVAGVRDAPGTRVLIHGAGGGVGSALLEMGRLFGFEMYGTASESKREVVTRLGGILIDYRSQDFEKVISKRTGQGVDLAIDPIGGSHFARSFRSVRPGGMLVATASMASVHGLSMIATIFHYLRVSLWDILPNGKSARFLDLVGLNESNPAWYRDDMSHLFDLLSQNEIDPIIAGTLPLSQASRAHQLLLDGEVEGKLVLIPG